MRKYQIYREEILQGNQVLSSLVLNPPYKFDGLTTSPKISKILSFPFGLRIDSSLIYKFVIQFAVSIPMLMTVSSLLLPCIYLPVEKQNTKLLTTAKSLTNEKLSLLVNLQEASSYNKLFSKLDAYPLKDTTNIIHVQTDNEDTTKQSTKVISFNKYPSVQFAGF